MEKRHFIYGAVVAGTLLGVGECASNEADHQRAELEERMTEELENKKEEFVQAIDDAMATKVEELKLYIGELTLQDFMDNQ